MDEKQYLEDLKANGVDLPELENPTPPETKEPEAKPQDDHTPEDKPKADPEGKDDHEEEPEKPENQEEEKQASKPRRIYEEYKEKKKDLRNEKERSKELERENLELKAIIEKGNSASTQEENEDVQDELSKFAEENEMSPDTLRQLKTILTKDISSLSEDDRRTLDDAKRISNTQSDEQSFNQEFDQAAPTLKEFFPELSEIDKEVIKSKLSELAHTDQYHDKEIDYIIYKSKDALSKLISPKKRGLESKSPQEKNGVKPTTTVDLNTSPDFSKMTESETIAWYNEYNKATSSNGELSTDSNGRKIII